MPTLLAQGTATTKRLSTPLSADAATPTEAELAAMTTADKIARLLIPQHTALLATVGALRAAATQLARLEPVGAPVVRRIVAVVEDLAVSMAAQFNHEERELFPSVIDGRGAANVASTIHDYHEGLSTRLRWLRLLATELRGAAGITYDTMVVFAGIATLARLFHRHRELEQWVVLVPAESRTAVGAAPRPRSDSGVRRRI